jgi:methylphosphotriester-DNA--protein-cysteine methyltransferase
MASSYVFGTREQKLQALRDRDSRAEGWFVYAVKSTGVVCRPTCSSRLALAKNIDIYPTAEQAVNDGYTPCKRCKPLEERGWNSQQLLAERAARLIDHMQSPEELNLRELAQNVGCTKWHLLRTFKRYIGQTPKQYLTNRVKKHSPPAEVPEIITKKHYTRNHLCSVDPKDVERSIIQSIETWQPTDDELYQMELSLK